MLKFKISPFTVLFAAFMIAVGNGYTLLSYFVAVIMHEMAHAEVARRRGYVLLKIKIMPYGASLTGNFEGITPRDEISVAFAGPFCNIAVAALTVAVWWLVPQTYFFTQVFAFANIFTALTNFMPIFPLDGGRALLGALSIKMPRQKAYKIVRIFGCVVGVAFVALTVLSAVYKINVTFALMASFVFAATLFPDKNSKYQRLYSMAYRSEKLKHGLAVREIMVADSLTLHELTKMLNGSYYSRFCVVNSRMEQVGTMTETALETCLTVYSRLTKLSDLPVSAYTGLK